MNFCCLFEDDRMTLTETLMAVFQDWGVFGLFFWSFVSATIVPVGSEPLLSAMLVTPGANFWWLILVATVGNLLGAYTTYWVGYEGTDHFLYKYFDVGEERMEKAHRYFSKYGAWVLLFTWLPLFGDVFVLIAGMTRYDLIKFSVLTFIGKFIRYLLFGTTFAAILTEFLRHI